MPFLDKEILFGILKVLFDIIVIVENDHHSDSEIKFPLRIDKLGDVFIQWDAKKAKYLYSQPRFYGKPLGARKIPPSGKELPYTYSYFEVCYLHREKIIEVYENDTKLSYNQLIEFCIENYDFFLDNYRIYCHFRDKKYVVRPGMKFGSEFIVYTTGPGIDHAEYVVHILHDHKMIGTFDLVKAGRLAGTVKKIFLLAYISEEDNVEFLQLDREKF